MIPESRIFKDQMGREVRVSFPPRRIIALVPSITELLVDLDVNVVGRTKFCIHPKSAISNIPIVGGTKNFRIDVIRELSPDLIIGNKEENYQEGIEELEREYPVWMSDIYDLDDARDMILQLGQLLACEAKSKTIVGQLQSKLNKVRDSKRGRIVYLIWKRPWIAVGRNNYINAFLTHMGYENLIMEHRYPEITLERLRALNPDKVLLSSEPYPFKTEDISFFSDHSINAELVDGEMYSWYGSRLIKLEL